MAPRVVVAGEAFASLEGLLIYRTVSREQVVSPMENMPKSYMGVLRFCSLLWVLMLASAHTDPDGGSCSWLPHGPPWLLQAFGKIHWRGFHSLFLKKISPTNSSNSCHLLLWEGFQFNSADLLGRLAPGLPRNSKLYDHCSLLVLGSQMAPLLSWGCGECPCVESWSQVDRCRLTLWK